MREKARENLNFHLGMEVIMELLFEIDLHDYELGDNVFSRPSARGVIFDDCGRIALVYSQKEKYYKFPGGGILSGEDKKEALIREVREETGLVVIPKSVREFGSVLRRQKSNKTPNTIFEQENFYYFCEVENIVTEQKLDEYEAEAGFILRFVHLDEAIDTNLKYKTEDFFDEIMIKRETKLLQMLKKKRGTHDNILFC